MAKFGVLKKITALATAIALVVCFAVSASAINVVTTTTYDAEIRGEVKVNVTVTGSELTAGTNVTYYATKDGADVHIDQTKVVEAGSATFEFNTAVMNLKSNALVGYTGASEANDDSTITGYTFTYPNSTQKVPTGVTEVTFAYDVPAGKVFKDVTVAEGTATISASSINGNGIVTVVFSEVKSDLTLQVNVEGDTGAVTAAAEFVDAGALTVGEGFIKEAVYVNGEIDEDFAAANADAEGDRKLTVIGKATSAVSYGIIVSEDAIAEGTYTAAAFAALAGDKYAAAGKDDATGMFAVQLIDTATEADDIWVAADTTYNTAVYVEDANGCFKVVAGDAVETAIAE